MKPFPLTLLLMFTLGCVAANAQDDEFKKFRVGFGVGYANPSGIGAKSGVLLGFEPGYRVTDRLLLNLRCEWAVMVRGTVRNNDLAVDVNVVRSYTLNGQYYLNKNTKFRPFAGLGAGIYYLAALELDDNNSTLEVAEAENKFGFYPRIGFDAGHFTFNIDYNIVGKTKGEYESVFRNNYIGVRISGFFGGGRKK